MSDQNDKLTIEKEEKVKLALVERILKDMVADGEVETKVIDGVRKYRWRKEQ